MTPASWETLFGAIRRAEALLCDWDGCLALDNQLLPNVADVLRAGPPFAIVSNNSTLPRADYRAILGRQGLAVEEAQIHLAGDAMMREAARRFPSMRIELVGVPAMRSAALDLGLRLVRADPEIVLLCRDTGLSFVDLERVANHVRNGAVFWVANGDMSHPVRNGVSPETGALATAVSAVAGRQADRVFGKPAPFLYQAALASLGVTAQQALMIGDNPATDIVGAHALDLPSLLIDQCSWVPGSRPSSSTTTTSVTTRAWPT